MRLTGQFRQSKIHYFNLAFFSEHDIRRFEVAMDYALLMSIC
ncbi:MAG: hypothetical protein BWY83_01916 [bacterium ADurb.Bin478]|nr:MAG: hypothetical protein BWY83_01916 [bacterium ADurb.Bin478]